MLPGLVRHRMVAVLQLVALVLYSIFWVAVLVRGLLLPLQMLMLAAVTCCMHCVLAAGLYGRSVQLQLGRSHQRTGRTPHVVHIIQ